MVLEIVQEIRSELLRAQSFVADRTSVQAHIMGGAAFGTTNFTDQTRASLLSVVAFFKNTRRAAKPDGAAPLPLSVT